ncbi:hypothetical protein [Halomarina pelagica]|uniref:hypothetical protein n=1 Tax=Halomarina pelagica TaxID=2961599 RepID=UPI0020C297AC|nr:hypothetical protein [Halomarina sp. BND7]
MTDDPPGPPRRGRPPIAAVAERHNRPRQTSPEGTGTTSRNGGTIAFPTGTTDTEEGHWTAVVAADDQPTLADEATKIVARSIVPD